MRDNFITKIKKNNFNNNSKLICADFETFLINDEHFVFAIGYYFNDKYEYIYIKNNLKDDEELKNESKNLMIEFIYRLAMISLKEKIFVYFHNLGSFDGIFIMKYINDYEIIDKKFNAVIRNNRIYKIIINNITFLDSMLLLNESLDKLAIKILNERKIFINYNKMSNYKTCIDNKEEIIKYLYKDVKILYDLIVIFKNKFKQLFGIDITFNFTIPSIAMRIFRQNYLNEDIYIPKDSEYEFIRKSYKGGLNNIIIPKISKGYLYDVNSLYPFIMRDYEMPIGKPNWIHKNFKDINEYFGFIDCTIEIPLDCQFPPLTIKRDETLIQPVGVIRDFFFIEEIKNSLQYGCKIIDIHTICNFNDKKVIFKDYVNDMYNKRLESNNTTDNLIYKLLMNSLYGKFGMKKEFSKTKILNEDQKWLYELVYNIENKFTGSNIITYTANHNYVTDLKKDVDNLYYEEDSKKTIKDEISKVEQEISRSINSVQISSAIAAYARIYMINEIYKHLKSNGKIYYYDTDSIHTDKLLDESQISQKELGKFKLEKVIKEGYYLSPKVYALLDIDGIETIKFKGLSKESYDNNINIEWFKEAYLNTEKAKFEFIKPIKKNINTLKVIKCHSKFESNFCTKKYNRVYQNGIWIRNNWTMFDDRKNPASYINKNIILNPPHISNDILNNPPPTPPPINI